MEKVTFQFKPEIRDYSRVIRSYVMRRRIYWIGLGVLGICLIFLLLFFLVSFATRDFDSAAYVIPIMLILILPATYPLWIGWLTIRSASNKEQLTLLATYEIDNEKIAVANELAEAKYSWAIFNQAFENEQYFLLNYSTNKNMVQFIPKRALVLQNQEPLARSLIVQHFGKIENIDAGITGWRLSLLSAFVFSLLAVCVAFVVFLF